MSVILRIITILNSRLLHDSASIEHVTVVFELHSEYYRAIYNVFHCMLDR